MMENITFDDSTNIKLFGKEDAENEDPVRLKEYFFRNKAYDNLVSGLPIRVLVGHKGVGKSALLRIAYLEDQKEGIFSLWLQSSDFSKFFKEADSDLNSLIEKWNVCLNEVIVDGILSSAFDDKKSKDKFLKGLAGYTGLLIKPMIEKVLGIFSEYPNDLKEEIKEKFINSYKNYQTIRIYIDDLDRGWEAKYEDIKKISALLNSIRDQVGSENKIHFRIGLRSDVYNLVRTSDESTDKIETNIIRLDWKNDDVLRLFAKRIESFFEKEIDEDGIRQKSQNDITKQYLSKVIVEKFDGRGKWKNISIHRVLLSLTRRRPRDIVKLFHGAARNAYKDGVNKISAKHLQDFFEQYSTERLQDIENEFKSELPDIAKLLLGMKPSKKELKTRSSYSFTNDALIKKIKDIMTQGNYRFTNNQVCEPRSLAAFLYKIDFITAFKEKEDGKIIRKFYDQNLNLQSKHAEFGFSWEIHPAYRWALQPQNIDDIFNDIIPSDE